MAAIWVLALGLFPIGYIIEERLHPTLEDTLEKLRNTLNEPR